MSTYKCTDCGEEYDCTLGACPNCGCPSEYQTGQTGQTSPLKEPAQDLSQKPERIPNRKKHIVLPILLFFVAGLITVGILYYQGHSHEIKMARFKKQAARFESTLDANSYLLSETIDTITQKVFYYVRENRSDNKYGTPIKDIKVYDLSTGETESIQLTSVDIKDYDFCGIELKDSKQIEDRLFIIIHSNCTWKYSATGVFYVDVRNNSLHYVESCNDAVFVGVDEIRIHKYYKTSYYEEKTEHKYYNLSTKLNDEAYAANRKEQKVIEERLQKEWFEKEEKRRKEEEIREVKSWLIGTWEWTGNIWGQRVWARLDISDDYIVASSTYGIDDQGKYSIDVDNQTIHYGSYSYVKYDKRKKIYADEGEPFRKVSNTPSFSTNSASNSYNSSSSSSNGNRTAQQLEKLDEEEANIIGIIDPIRRSGQFYPDILVKVMRMKQINDERIRLARQSGNQDLLRYYESKKIWSEAIIRQWGFD